MLSALMSKGYVSKLPLGYIINQNLCFLDGFIIYPLNFSIISVFLIIILKFVILKNLNNRKIRIYQNKGSKLKMNWFFGILKISNYNIVTFIFIILFMIFMLLFQLIIYSIFRFDCFGISKVNISNGYYLSFILLIIVCGIIITIYDFFLNFTKIRKFDIIGIWKDDLYYLRFEAYFIGILCGSCIFIVYMITFYLIGESISYTIFNTLTYLIIYLSFGGFSLFITIIYFFTSFCRYSKVITKEGDLKNLLKSEDGFELMLKTCKKGNHT